MKFANAVVIGVAMLAVAGGAAIAEGTQPRSHGMTVKLPDGGVAHVRYTGNVAPEVVVTQGPAFSFRTGFAPFGSMPAFGELDRVSSDMNHFRASFDRQVASMMSANENMIRALGNPDHAIEAAFGKMPAGSYSTVTEFATKGACTRMVKITSQPGQAKPEMVSQTSGDCGRTNSGAALQAGSFPVDNGATPISSKSARPGFAPSDSL